MDISEFFRLLGNKLKSENNSIKFQKFQAKWVISDSLKKFYLISKNVLDLGSGLGGYSQEFLNAGAKVYAKDLNIIRNSRLKDNYFLVKGDCVSIPIKTQSMEIVFCSSLIEHIHDHEQLVCEINRVLKNHGICHLSYPPFYSPVGCHQFKAFHLLGEEFASKCSKYIYRFNLKDYKTSFGNWGLYPTIIRKIENITKRNNFILIDIKTSFSPFNFAKIPILNEILTWHVEFITEKIE